VSGPARGEEEAVALGDIMGCFEGVIPSPICSCSADGVPNVTYLSVVHLLDDEHVALSFQFFNKTKRNILENPRAQVILVEPVTGLQFRLDLLYQRSESAGPVFERMRTNLDAVASHTGMGDRFRLRGVDVYRVLRCRKIRVAHEVPLPRQRPERVDALEELASRLAAAPEVDDLVTTALASLDELFGYEHSMLLVADETATGLYTVASHGYPRQGAGAEVRFGEGISGVAAAERKAVRVTNMRRALVMSRAAREGLERDESRSAARREIPLPGLPDVLSQLAVPLVARGQVVGVLCLESSSPGRFQARDERVVGVAAGHLAATLALLRQPRRAPRPAAAAAAGGDQPAPSALSDEPLRVRHYREDDSVFFDGDYVIKGVAGRILWRLLRLFAVEGRTEFTNREIRLDRTLDLPRFRDNLETRLLLLRRRLEDRGGPVRVTSSGRGRLRLQVERPLALQELAG
jgi:hypothetical protein